ncbi:MAG: hypothetical protein B7X91_05465 [Hydrogenophilales bacterium 17-64-11]|nr:MAG: hypothetical protein B7X91_05465 [Hydrogenophilales bacterium 17-64-11]
MLILLMLAVPLQTFASAAMLDCLVAPPPAAAAQMADAAMADCHEQEQQPGSPSASPDCAHCAACALASALPIPAADAASPAPAAHRYTPHPAVAFGAFVPDGPERPPRPGLT